MIPYFPSGSYAMLMRDTATNKHPYGRKINVDKCGGFIFNDDMYGDTLTWCWVDLAERFKVVCRI